MSPEEAKHYVASGAPRGRGKTMQRDLFLTQALQLEAHGRAGALRDPPGPQSPPRHKAVVAWSAGRGLWRSGTLKVTMAT